jgi:hypothetical protein
MFARARLTVRLGDKGKFFHFSFYNMLEEKISKKGKIFLSAILC